MIEDNKYIASYVNGIIKSFRIFKKDVVYIRMSGVKKMFNTDTECLEFISFLSSFNFMICIEGESDNVSTINVSCTSGNVESNFVYQLDSLPTLIALSSTTKISLNTLVIMKVVSIYISRTKTIYKAFALDLDETLWNGTLSEDGIETIKNNLCSEGGKPFISFMSFVSNVAKELGIFVAICSRNEIYLVEEAIEQLDERSFPLKNQIDCIVANNNDKSSNLIKIAEQLSILPSSIIFIDDNKIIRDEVRHAIPDMLVPEWTDHQDLILQIMTGGYFDRHELSLSSQSRRKEYKIIREEKKRNSLPPLKIRVRDDINHEQSQRLYAKSNQFKTSDKQYYSDRLCQSIIFELYRENGDSLGLCSAVTFCRFDDNFVILNWAISCRYFEIGLEEFVILYLTENYKRSSIDLIFQDNNRNKKVIEFLDKYYGTVIFDDNSSIPNDSKVFVEYLPESKTKELFRKLNDSIGSFRLYSIDRDDKILNRNTNLKLIEND